MTDHWHVFKVENIPHNGIEDLPAPPPWRQFKGVPQEIGRVEETNPHYEVDDEIARLVNSAIYLRRPLLVTGKAGTGKSSLARAIAYQLKLGNALVWPITSRSTLQEGLYTYDAIGRLQEANLKKEQSTPPDIGKYLRLGPLGTALLPSKNPWVLLIDEIDKSDIDLPNDLLHVFENGRFEIPELVRMADIQETVKVRIHNSEEQAEIHKGQVECAAFPIIVLTSNGEREFPAPFLRRCIRLMLREPNQEKLARIVRTHFGLDNLSQEQNDLIDKFLKKRTKEELATDQLLNTIYMVRNGIPDERVMDDLLRSLIND